MQWVAMMVGRIFQLWSVGIHRRRCGVTLHQCRLPEALLVLQYLATSERVVWLFDSVHKPYKSFYCNLDMHICVINRITTQTVILLDNDFRVHSILEKFFWFTA